MSTSLDEEPQRLKQRGEVRLKPLKADLQDQEVTMEARTVVLRPDLRQKETIELENKLRAKILWQEAGIPALVELFRVVSAGLKAPNRPTGRLLFLGPTGTGKTRL